MPVLNQLCEIFSSVIIIPQSNTRDMEYVNGQLKKVSLEQLLFE